MKRIYTFLCIAVILLTLTACNANVGTGSGGSDTGFSSSTGNTNSSGHTTHRKKSYYGTPSGSGYNGSGNSGGSGYSGQGQPLGARTKTSGCQPQGGIQDKACTPGAVFPDATKDQICQPGYTKGVRNVPISEKDQVYQEYGIQSHSAGQYEVDHLVPLEVGGSNDISNLWPEAASPQPGFHQKDQLENYLHDQVCSGAMGLKDAQIKIATDWLSIYNQMPGH